MWKWTKQWWLNNKYCDYIHKKQGSANGDNDRCLWHGPITHKNYIISDQELEIEIRLEIDQNDKKIWFYN